MKVIQGLFVTLMLSGACSFPKFKNPTEMPVDVPEYAVVFNEIDDVAALEINGREVFRSKDLLRAADEPLVVDIKEYLVRGNNAIKVTLIDTPEGKCLNNEWGINFDIYSEGELFDYWQQNNESADCEDGIKVEKEFTLRLTTL